MEPYFARRVNAGTTPSGENTTNTTTKSNNTNTEKDDAGEEEEEETRLADAVDDAKEVKKSPPPPEEDQLFLQGSRETTTLAGEEGKTMTTMTTTEEEIAEPVDVIVVSEKEVPTKLPTSSPSPSSKGGAAVEGRGSTAGMSSYSGSHFHGFTATRIGPVNVYHTAAASMNTWPACMRLT